MVRGIEKRNLFRSDDDRADLLERIGFLVPETGAAIYAWRRLMPNHFHRLLRSGQAGLSTFMRRLQTGYAGAFNRRHGRSGHLFQNRFKSSLVEEEAYFLELVRYLHLNPRRSGLVRSLPGLAAYPWSGRGKPIASSSPRASPRDNDQNCQAAGSSAALAGGAKWRPSRGDGNGGKRTSAYWATASS